ncbi:hypothetical protein A1O1_03055 [Capronia coronata CBS 617.96]|uniref:Zn(2)-C6 fungal-type domain-containing protein n=1 Tax=Capronia coronata CBS 617.96 TaxID=1182541 RepID=W9ZJH4_9EURO|nr:uncharacterized protein A1O1_03055 [Capronia coronata CBS 617.96]EXJ94659.1 hypothetical protein A1O1_03055 [Capronia coronata CBS 617.96]
MGRDAACLTCRSRKVRCDRLLPRCSTCTRLNRECTTSTKPCEVTWLHPHLGARSLQDDDLVSERTQQQPGAKGRPLLTDLERARHIATLLSSTQDSTVEELLTDLDTRLRDLESNDVISLGPFGVFRPNDAVTDERLGDDASESQLQITPSTSPICEAAAMIGDFDLTYPASDLSESQLLPPFADDQLSIFGPSEIDWNDFHVDLGTDPTCSETISMTKGISSSLPIAMSLTYSFDVHDLDFPTIRLLLDRYQHTLVPYLVPARVYTKSPWEALHIPKVHETLGEVILRGDAGNAKLCLFFAVLGASAFHLDVLRTSTSEVTPPWRVIGDSYRARAKARLKISLQSLSRERKEDEEDYKDVLLALLSMVTVCVVSGDMDEAYAYLHDVEHLIALYGVDKIRQSADVQMLYSTYLYLRTLQASVSSFSGQGQAGARSIKEPPERPDGTGSAITVTLKKHNNNLWSSLLHVDGQSNASMATATELPCHICGRNTSIFEQIYSLPESLFQLISRVTELAQRMEELRRNEYKTSITGRDPLSDEVAQLETDVCGWKNEVPNPEHGHVPLQCPNCMSNVTCDSGPDCIGNPSRTSLLYHFREAMHSALLIYFYRCVRRIDTHILQHFVIKTIEHLSRYGERKRESNDPSSNLCWPGFIAGCEALDTNTRELFSAWFSRETALTGIRMFEVAGQAVKQVWEARDLKKDRNLSWSYILKENKTLDKLVLS